MRRSSTPLVVILILLLAAALGVAWQNAKPFATPKQGENSEMQASATETQLGAISPVRAAGEPEADAAPSPAEDADPAHYRRAYLLSLDSGKLSLENTEDIQGDFAMRRGPQEEWSGMLRCRLVSEEGKVLAEELLPAPDHLCTVLDSYDGTPKPVSYTVAGPVMFQLRLPRLAAATRLDISRITGPGALARDIPVGSLSLTSP